MSASPTMLAYTGALLRVEDSRMHIHSCDGDTSAVFDVDASDTVDGRALLPPAPLLNWLRTLPGDTGITLTCDAGTHLDVAFGSAAPYRFRTLNATFPVPAWAGQGGGGEPVDGFSAALAAVSASAAGVADVSDKVVHLVTGVDGATLYTTDTFRITRARLAGASFAEQDLLLYLRTLHTAAKWGVTGVTTDVSGTVLIAVDGGLVGVRPLAAPFPPAEQVMNAPAAYRTTFDTSDVLGVLSRMKALSGGADPVVIDLDGETMTLSIDAESTGSGSETVPVGTPVDEPVRFGLNVDYFRQSLESLSSTATTLEWTSANAPVRLSTADPMAVTVVVMPVKLA